MAEMLYFQNKTHAGNRVCPGAGHGGAAQKKREDDENSGNGQVPARAAQIWTLSSTLLDGDAHFKGLYEL